MNNYEKAFTNYLGNVVCIANEPFCTVICVAG